ncbi:MAG: UDP-N-acetylmuramate dehydrogenase [Gammaproteobacteria bacterium]|nr:UDP-N-acetylmuramate dehydrogenase [Gammaproteobacteria bacterium]
MNDSPTPATGPTWLRDLPLRGRVSVQEPMARHCSWRAGGAAERFFAPADLPDLAMFLRAAPPTEVLTAIGLGSNLLVRDGGLRGTVIAFSPACAGLAWHADHTVQVGAGVACAKVAKIAARRQLGGGEFLAGIPGTIGGALAMNAGAFGHAIWDLVEAVEIITRGGDLQRRPAAAFKAAYRQLDGLNQAWFVGAILRLDADAAAAGRVRALLAQRSAAQPLGLPSCGSVFKNPPGDFAGRLIEAAERKSARLGGAYVSPKHANFIINDGTASAADIEDLLLSVQASVAQRFGVCLESEVRIVGERVALGGTP